MGPFSIIADDTHILSEFEYIASGPSLYMSFHTRILSCEDRSSDMNNMTKLDNMLDCGIFSEELNL